MTTTCPAQHDQLNSRYCAQCGKKLGNVPIQDLLAHLESAREKARVRLQQIEQWNTEGRYAHEELYAIDKQRVHDTIDKWQSWLDVLDKLMNPPEET